MTDTVPTTDPVLTTNPLLTQGPEAAPFHIVLAHGAGAPMTSPFMERMTTLLCDRGLRVSRFEFAYMAARRTGTRMPPPRAENLCGEYTAVVTRLAASLADNHRLVIGGKSLGGRVASLVADDLNGRALVAALVCLGYPFHPPTKPEQLRTAHLKSLRCPALIVQGERDPFGTREEVATYGIDPSICIDWIEGANHDLETGRGKDARERNLAATADAIVAFLAALPAPAGS